ncbi:MAG: hypothetical protein LJE70_17595 [Chromatiaceae bacterium]|nr:hypothetical protein [Chromatiaceae bacterium]
MSLRTPAFQLVQSGNDTDLMLTGWLADKSQPILLAVHRVVRQTLMDLAG